MERRMVYGSVVAIAALIFWTNAFARPEPPFPEDTSYIAKAIFNALNENYKSARGSLWDFSADNELSNNWLIRTTNPNNHKYGKSSCGGSEPACVEPFHLPVCTKDSDCGNPDYVAARCAFLAGSEKKMCVGDGDTQVVQPIYDVLASAKHYIDIATLGVPDGRFWVAMRKGIAAAVAATAKSEQPLVVRMLMGQYKGQRELDLAQVESEILALVPAKDHDKFILILGISAPSWSTSRLVSWNHSKIIAVDGRAAIVGGMNLVSDDFLSHSPVSDFSMLVEGAAANQAQAFVNQLWSNLWKAEAGEGAARTSATLAVKRITRIRLWKAQAYQPFDQTFETAWTRSSSNPGVAIFSVGRIGDDKTKVPADRAILAMIEAAKDNVLLMQQSYLSPSLPVAGIDVPVLDSLNVWRDLNKLLARKLEQGVKIKIVLSFSDRQAKSRPPKTVVKGYPGGNMSETVERIIRGVPKRNRTEACNKLEVYPLKRQYVHDDQAYISGHWPNNEPVASHAKVIVVDNKTFYIGSENVYPSEHDEFGFIVDSATYTPQLWSQIGDYRALKDSIDCKAIVADLDKNPDF